MELSHLLNNINHIHSYFQNAAYGKRLYKIISVRLKEKQSIRGLSERSLYTCIEFYKAYPQILQTVSAKFENHLQDFLIEFRSRLLF